MNSLLNIFSTREIAICIWFIIFLCFISRTKSVRHSIVNVIKSFFEKKILFSLCTAFLYFLFIVYILYYIGLWNWSLLKETLIWFFFIGMVHFFNVNRAKDINYFTNLFKDNFKVTIIWEFLYNVYTFSLCVELILIPIVSLLFLLITYIDYSCKGNEEYEKVGILCNNILKIIGLSILAYVIYKMIIGYEQLITFANIKLFFLPIIIAILMIPYFYLFALYINYEVLFIRVNTLNYKGRRYVNMVKLQILESVNFNLNKLSRINKNFSLLKNAADIRTQIKYIVKKKPYEKGLVGNIARIHLFNDIENCRKILSTIGIGLFSEWHNVGFSYQSVSPYFELIKSPSNSYMNNNIVCSIDGNESYIKQLTFTLNINNKEHENSSLIQFSKYIEKIFELLDIKEFDKINSSIKTNECVSFENGDCSCKLDIIKNRIDIWEFSLITKEK